MSLFGLALLAEDVVEDVVVRTGTSCSGIEDVVVRTGTSCSGLEDVVVRTGTSCSGVEDVVVRTASILFAKKLVKFTAVFTPLLT